MRNWSIIHAEEFYFTASFLLLVGCSYLLAMSHQQLLNFKLKIRNLFIANQQWSSKVMLARSAVHRIDCVQVVSPDVQMPAQCCSSLSQQQLCTTIIIGQETTTAFLCQRHSGQSADKNCSWSSRVQSVQPCDVECSADRTAYCYCVSIHFWQTIENLLVQEHSMRAH